MYSSISLWIVFETLIYHFGNLYWFSLFFIAKVKNRWAGKTIVDLFTEEFKGRPYDYYVWFIYCQLGFRVLRFVDSSFLWLFENLLLVYGSEIKSVENRLKLCLCVIMWCILEMCVQRVRNKVFDLLYLGFVVCFCDFHSFGLCNAVRVCKLHVVQCRLMLSNREGYKLMERWCLFRT